MADGQLPSPDARTGGRMSVLIRLSLMMFLQYAVWGAWLPIAARYLEAPQVDIT